LTCVHRIPTVFIVLSEAPGEPKMEYEPAIERFLTRNGTTGMFVVPQYHVGKEPDFVGLDFKRCRIVVVEVSAAWDVSAMIDKFRNRKSQLEEPLRRHLEMFPGYTAEQLNWPIKYFGFVRRDRLAKAQGEFTDANDVRFIAIESATHAHEYSDRDIE
jgi:hypothetical protein